MMLRRVFSCSLFLLCSVSLISEASLHSASTSLAALDEQTSEDSYLSELLCNYFDLQLYYDPEASTYLGKDNELDEYWSEFSEADLTSRKFTLESFAKDLETINFDALSNEGKINYELLKRTLNENREMFNSDLYLLPLSQMGGPPLDVLPVLQAMPCRNITHYHRIFERLKKIPRLIDQTVELMQRGVDKGVTFPKSALWSLPGNLEKMIAAAPETSVFFKSFKALLNLDENEAEIAENIRNQAIQVIADEIYPSYHKLVEFIREAYIPRCRDNIGFSDMPRGRELYQILVQKYTTTRLTPAEIHQLGLGEVARIQQEMRNVISEACYEGTIEDYMSFLANDPSFYFTDKESLLEGYKTLTKSIEEQLPKFFGMLPTLPFEVVPIPAHSEEGQITAYYMPGSASAGRPGRFFVNTYDIATRPKWQMESLALHEAVPGHHFQISLAQELPGLCEFRRHYGCTAYIEGWGLYSESLGTEFGLGKTPSARFGRLIEEMMRAVRLVVDTGIHEFGWTRDRAISYMMEHTGFHEREAATEIDRYCVMPGQALAYKVGELSMQKWKREAKESLAEAFDIRQFHDVLLGHGTLPLDLCERIIHDWIEASN